MPDDQQQQQPAKKKRTADVQLTKDDHEHASSRGDEDGMIDAKDDPRLKKGTFERASTDVLKKRRILKVNRGAPKPTEVAAAAPKAEGADEKKAESGDVKAEAKGAADAGGATETEKDANKEAEGEEKKKNPFSAVSFAAAAKSNPFAAVDLAATKRPSSDAGGSTTGFGFGAGTAASAGFGATKADDKKDGDSKEGEDDKSKPFVFGSGTAAASGFGAASSGTSRSVFGFGTAASSGFGAAAKAAPSTGFGTSVFGAAAATSAGTTGVPKINLPDPKSPAGDSPATAAGVFDSGEKVDTDKTGEEEEERVFQARAKLFRMVPSEKSGGKDSKKSEGAGASATAQAEVGPSVPPATTSAPTKGSGTAADDKETDGKEDDKKEEEKGGDDEKKKESAVEQNGKDEGKDKTAPSWREVGIGPLRILLRRRADSNGQKKEGADDEEGKGAPTCSYRVVQRRESTPGGPGTKLILNVPLRGDGSCTVARQAENFVRLATVEEVEVDANADAEKAEGEDSKAGEDKNEAEEGEGGKKKGGKKTEQRTVLYLFKVKAKADADDLQRRLEEGCGGASS